jgi:hypothetical protein
MRVPEETLAMTLPIRLSAQQRIESRLFARSGSETQSGWLHLTAEFGSARVKLTDGGNNPLGEQPVSSPSLLSSCIIASSAGPVILEIIAGDAGFQGRLQVDMLKT